MSSAHEVEPAYRAPALSCDSHFHVFGAAERYPYGMDLPPLAPLTGYLALARHLGFERFVFVQPSAYGRDNACMLEAMHAVGAMRSGNGRCWVKLTGVYRMSTAAGFADAAPMARALIEAAPDRIIWGSDYPHLSFAGKVGSVELFNLLARWAPDERTRHRILVDNPQQLFGF
ncbi:MAG: amidohydrolase family protein [Betaproteobacteria bacterium]